MVGKNKLLMIYNINNPIGKIQKEGKLERKGKFIF